MTDGEGDGAEKRRKGRRGPALWEARLRIGADRHRCRVYDFSLAGAKIWIDVPLELGAAIKLEIDQIGLIKGRVAWADSNRMGIEFTSDVDEVRYLLGPRKKFLGLE